MAKKCSTKAENKSAADINTDRSSQSKKDKKYKHIPLKSDSNDINNSNEYDIPQKRKISESPTPSETKPKKQKLKTENKPSDDVTVPQNPLQKTLSVLNTIKNRKKKKQDTEDAEKEEPEIKNISEKSVSNPMTIEEALLKYPILNDEALVKKYQTVSLTNNQKGRIRQQFKSYFQCTTGEKVPEAMNLKIAELLKRESLTDSDYRRIRILHNMLRTAVMDLVEKGTPILKKKKKNKSKKNKEDKRSEEIKKTTVDAELETHSKQNEIEAHSEIEMNDINDTELDPEKTNEEKVNKDKIKDGKDKANEVASKVKGPKRYVVFVGNLPYDIDKDGIMRHFASLVGKIKDIRIPKREEKQKGGMAYVEFADETSYQMALSKHHSMFQNRRINVLYTTTGKSRIDKKEAKGKRAKLLALQKSGQLLGSTPLGGKRSARRKKHKAALARAAKA